MLGYIKKH